MLLGYCNRVEDVLSREFYGISAAERFRSSTCIPPAVPLLTILIGVGLSRLAPINWGFALPKPERYWLGGLVVAGAFFGLGLWSVILLRRTGQSENPWKPTSEIVESGPFRVTRNPIYI